MQSKSYAQMRFCGCMQRASVSTAQPNALCSVTTVLVHPGGAGAAWQMQFSGVQAGAPAYVVFGSKHLALPGQVSNIIVRLALWTTGHAIPKAAPKTATTAEDIVILMNALPQETALKPRMHPAHPYSRTEPRTRAQSSSGELITLILEVNEKLPILRYSEDSRPPGSAHVRSPFEP